MNYFLDHDTSRTSARGVLRLESVDAYEAVFGRATRALSQAEGSYTLDLSGVTLMNSSGIRALANLVLLAKRHGTSLILHGSSSVPWQHKTMASLGALYDGLQIRLA